MIFSKFHTDTIFGMLKSVLEELKENKKFKLSFIIILTYVINIEIN